MNRPEGGMLRLAERRDHVWTRPLIGVLSLVIGTGDACGQTPSSGGSISAAASGGGVVASGPAIDVVPAIPPPMRAQDPLLPSTGLSTSAGDFDRTLDADLQGPTLTPAARAWSVTPSAGFGEEYTDNVYANGGSGTGRGSDLITLLLPGLVVAGDTPRVQGSFSYNPDIEIYARNSSQDQIDENFDGQMLAALVPGTLFVDLRGDGAVTSYGLGGQPGTGYRGQLGSQASAANQATQTVDLAVTPYAVHRFATLGTGEIGGTLERTTEDAVNGNANGLAVPALAGSPGISPFANPGNQDATTIGGHAAFQSGEAFGRYDALALLQGEHTSGTGVLASASRNTGTLDNGYAITRNVTALLRVGYEYITYAGTNPLRISDEIWDVGVRLSAAPDTTVEVRYGHHDGFNAATLDAAVQATTRTRLFARYSEGLTTADQQLQNGLATSDLDGLGDPVDHSTGTPLVLADNFFGAQDNLYRTQLASVTGVLTEDRDIFNVGVQYENNQLVSSSGLPFALGNNSGIYGSLGWSHAISPTLSLSANAQYGVRRSDGLLSTVDHVTYASLALAKALSDTLATQFSYSYNNDSSRQPGSNYSANVVLLTLSKSFR